MSKKPWLFYALLVTALWGVWGAFSAYPIEQGFPETLVYVVWALTMLPPAILVLKRGGKPLQCDRRSVLYGALIGLLGAGGQLLLFYALRKGPAYLIFPVISLSPVITIVLSYFFLKERTGKLGLLGIVLALIALPLFDYAPGGASVGLDSAWFGLAILVLFAWGLQAFAMKQAHQSMTTESIFFYMMLCGLLLIPVALWMTDFSKPVNWQFSGPYLSALIQLLNSFGALFLVYAFRHGKAMVVSPLTNAGAPLLTALISMAVLSAVPSSMKSVAIALSLVAAILLAFEPEAAEAEVTGH